MLGFWISEVSIVTTDGEWWSDMSRSIVLSSLHPNPLLTVK
jgi:hypothetical protein